MHLVMENVIEQLLDLWSGTYKSAIHLGNATAISKEPYVISKKTWKDIDKDVVDSAKLIPAFMTGSIPSVSKRWRWTAETHLFFLLTLGPIVLKDRLPASYFHHFLDLSELTKIMVQTSVSEDSDLPALGAGLRRWVARFDE